jgi:hypothetical protein
VTTPILGLSILVGLLDRTLALTDGAGRAVSMEVRPATT